jgi:biotin carboxyl carrier protein
MEGKVLSIRAGVGQSVEEDDVILIMEAMKMEISVVAPVNGTITEIKVSAGQAVDPETVVAVIG